MAACPELGGTETACRVGLQALAAAQAKAKAAANVIKKKFDHLLQKAKRAVTSLAKKARDAAFSGRRSPRKVTLARSAGHLSNRRLG